MVVSISNEDIAYVAGLFDGDGCVMCKRPRYNLLISIANTNVISLKFVMEHFGGSIITFVPQGNRLLQYFWRQSGKIAAGTLKKLLPYLIIRKERAILGIELVDIYCGSPRRKQIFDLMRDLNSYKVASRNIKRSPSMSNLFKQMEANPI